jgi:hypothetical protein
MPRMDDEIVYDYLGVPVMDLTDPAHPVPKRKPRRYFEVDESGRVIFETDGNGVRHPKRRLTGEFELDAQGHPIPERDSEGNPVLTDGLPVFRKRTHWGGAFEVDANGFIRMERDANGERHPKRIPHIVDELDQNGLPVMDPTDPAHRRRKQIRVDDYELDAMPIVGLRNFVQLADFLQNFDQVALSEPMKALETRWIELRMAGQHGRLHESEARFVQVVNALDHALAGIVWLSEY